MPLYSLPDKILPDSTRNDASRGFSLDETVQVKADSTSAKPPTGKQQNLVARETRIDHGGTAKRTVFTKRQLSELEARFRDQTFLSKEERGQLAEDLNLTERQVMIWFQNRRGRLKRRGPADTAYTSDKLKELNTRRPYPFLYGLLSSMQYRHTHHHPYKHLVAGAPTTTDPDGRPLSSDPRQPPMSQASDTGLWHGPFSSRHPPQSSAQRVQGIGVSLPSQPGTLQPQAFHDNRANQTPQITISNSSIRQHGNPNMCVQQNHNIGLPQSTFYHDMDNNVIVSSNQQCGGNDKFTASWGVTSSGFPRTQIPMSSAPYVAAQCSNWTSSGTTPNTSQNFGFERQIEHFGSLPEFPDITTGLYAYPSPTC